MSKTKHLLIITALAVTSLPSCSNLLTPDRQAKLDQAAEKYEATAGITPAQTGGLLFKWFGDYNEAKAANELRKAESEATSGKEVMPVTTTGVFDIDLETYENTHRPLQSLPHSLANQLQNNHHRSCHDLTCITHLVRPSISHCGRHSLARSRSGHVGESGATGRHRLHLQPRCRPYQPGLRLA